MEQDEAQINTIPSRAKYKRRIAASVMVARRARVSHSPVHRVDFRSYALDVRPKIRLHNTGVYFASLKANGRAARMKILLLN
jgi:hypothetical protein